MMFFFHLATLLTACALKGASGNTGEDFGAGAVIAGDPKAFPTELRLLKGEGFSKSAPRNRSKESKKGTMSKGKAQSPLPSFVTSFKKLTFVPGGVNGFDDTIQEEDGVSFRMIADITTIETGIVSLAGAQSLLSHVKCSDDGSIRVSFNKVIREEYLSEMFPQGSMLVIDGATLGSCYLGVDEGEDEKNFYWTDRFPDSAEDGYLFIEDVFMGASDKEAVIRGSRSSFFFMFDEADILVEPLPTNESEANGTIQKRQLRSIKKDFTAKAEFPKGKSPLKVKAKVSFLVFAGIGFHAKWKFRKGMTLTISFEYEVTTVQQLGVYLSKGRKSQTKTYNLINYPLFAIPTIKLLKRLGLTSPKLGAYIDVDYFIEYALRTSAGASAVATNEMSTGRKKLEFWVNGKWKGLSAGVRKKTNKKAKRNGAFFNVTVPKALTAQAVVFTGIQPGVWLYLFGLGRAGVYQRTGVELDAVASTAALAPVKKKNGATVGPCKTCHNFHTKVDLVVENLSYEFGLRIKFKIEIPILRDIKINENFKKGGTLPGKLRVDLFTACALGRKDETPCKTTCCKKGFKCVAGRCRKALALPTKKPTRKPTKHPTKRPTKKPTRRPTQRPTAAPTPGTIIVH